MRVKDIFQLCVLVSLAKATRYDRSSSPFTSGPFGRFFKDPKEKEGITLAKQTAMNCVPSRARCITSEDCCQGTACFYGTCNEGLPKNNRGEPSDQVKLIEMEMSTGHDVDVTTHENINLLPTFEVCGRFNLNNKKKPQPHSRHKRIVGGAPVPEGKYPWLVSLNLNYKTSGGTLETFHCGGSLINRQYVLTAAHCCSRIPMGLMMKYATLGNVDRRVKYNCEKDLNAANCTREKYIDVEIEDLIIHEEYSEATTHNDIALIRLKHEVNYTDFIQPICLPVSERIFKKWHDGKLTVAGWGNQNTPLDTGPAIFSYLAQEIDMILVHRSSCDRFFTRSIGKIRKSQICAVGQPGKADCGGDSGGPLFKKVEINEDGAEEKDERYFVFGLVSTGDDKICGREGKPSIFTNVVDYMPWILDHLIPKSKTIGDSLAQVAVNPVEEFATGFNMDVRGHKNVALLPTECGKIEDHLDHAGPPIITHVNVTHSRRKRIVGGMVQSIGVFPWMAQIYVKHVVTTEAAFRCGGSLISKRHILTSAHCVTDLRGPYALDGVMLGNFNHQEKKECIGNICMEQVIVPIEEIFVHDGFTRYARVHDLAIVKLSHDVTFNRLVQPICLPLYEDMVAQAWPEPNIDRRYIAAGWGQVTSDDDPGESVFSNILIGANFTLESKRYCEGALSRKIGKLENLRICGGGSIPGRGECNGDTGGPMMRWVTHEGPDGQMRTRMYVFGVTARVECAHQGVPSLYQNLIFHMPWLMDHLDA